MQKIQKSESFEHSTSALTGWYYQLPNVEHGKTIVYAEVHGDHGQRTIGDVTRIYFIIEGHGEFIVNSDSTKVTSGDVVVIPPRATYSYHATRGILKLVLFMELLDINKLPKSK